MNGAYSSMYSLLATTTTFVFNYETMSSSLTVLRESKRLTYLTVKDDVSILGTVYK